MLKEYNYDKIPVVDLVDEIISDSASRNASDIHFDPTPTILKVRIRVDGELIDYTDVPETIKNSLITRIKIISGMNITESRLPQDGAIKNIIEGKNLDLRVSTLPIVYGEKVVIRILDYTMSNEGLESLGFSPENFKKVKKMIETPNGIILITGATGTGKSTTVYSMLQILNTPERNIITVEDPVEMKLNGVNQVQTMSEIGLTFAKALRSILRQDPDVIMIGEIRDDETARIAVRASITGHLVLSTIHTNNSLNTIERLLDMDVERYLLGSALEGVISQRLVKKLCPKCRKTRKVTEYEKNVFQAVLGLNITDIYAPIGCDECYHGYKGRIAIQEVLAIDQPIRDAIASNVSKDELRRLVYTEGSTITLLQDGLKKVINGLTSFEEIIRVIDIEDDLEGEEKKLKDVLIGKSKLNTTQQNNIPNQPINNSNPQIRQATIQNPQMPPRPNPQVTNPQQINNQQILQQPIRQPQTMSPQYQNQTINNQPRQVTPSATQVRVNPQVTNSQITSNPQVVQNRIINQTPNPNIKPN